MCVSPAEDSGEEIIIQASKVDSSCKLLCAQTAALTPQTNFLRVIWRLELNPRAPGTNPDGKLNNWRPYFVTHWLYP